MITIELRKRSRYPWTKELVDCWCVSTPSAGLHWEFFRQDKAITAAHIYRDTVESLTGLRLSVKNSVDPRYENHDYT